MCWPVESDPRAVQAAGGERWCGIRLRGPAPVQCERLTASAESDEAGAVRAAESERMCRWLAAWTDRAVRAADGHDCLMRDLNDLTRPTVPSSAIQERMAVETEERRRVVGPPASLPDDNYQDRKSVV